MRLFPAVILYIQIWENRLKVVNVQSLQQFDEVALIGVKHAKKGLQLDSIGYQARKSIKADVEVSNPFDHPRSLLNNFYLSAMLIQQAMKQVYKTGRFKPLPQIIMHPMEKLEGGLTGIEERAFQELAFQVGGRDVVVYSGAEIDVVNDAEKCHQLLKEHKIVLRKSFL